MDPAAFDNAASFAAENQKANSPVLTRRTNAAARTAAKFGSVPVLN